MFYIHQSNQMELLAHKLSALFGATSDKKSGTNPFAQEKVLVQSPGMSQWLKIYLAQQLGVMANIDFPLPSSFIWSLYKELIKDLPDQSAFNKGEMAWKLYTILPNHLDDESFLPLKNYLQSDNNGLMLFQLSEKIADVFDQYLMYRPDWIEAWEANEDNIKDGDAALHPWQPILWRALKDHTADLQQSKYHRANLHDVLLERLAQAFADKSHKIHADVPQRLFIFGISALPSQQLHVFEQLSEHVDIHLMLFNPCEHYWGDIVDEKQLAKVQARFANKKHLGVDDQNYMTVGNPLLASWGKLGRDYLEQLLEINADQYDYFVEPIPANMLCRIQADVFNLSFRDQIDSLTPTESLTDAGKQNINANDNSLMFHACHSPLREVEVLYDQLLHLFEQGSSPSPTSSLTCALTPKDIIVMMPDVSLYSPYIDAVFAGSEVNRIPYAISDKGFVLENPILNSFLQLMKLPDSRFSASELLDLISVPATTLVMGLVEEDIELIRNWINEVGIRWGIDSDHKQSLDLPNDELNSWRFGLNRLLMGYAIGNETLVDGILPYKHVEGQNAETLGKLVFFIDTLIGYRAQLAEAATISEKIATVNALVAAFYQTDKDEEQAINTIRQVLIEFETHHDTKNCEQPISQKVFAYYLNNAFNDKGIGQRFLAGQVNFCTLMPMRSIPFKVICLLGMNDADYPRFVAPVGFDLMATGKTRKGDRSRRLDDRYLLLEAMLSARDKLYISYVGHSMQDNSEKIPSVLVTELLEYCEQAFTFDETHDLNQSLVQFHPLQPFNPAYFDAQSSLSSYQPHWYRYVNQKNATTDSQIAEQPIDDSEIVKTLDLEQLIRFMLHPVKYFFNHTLQLYFSPLTQVEQDDETFVLDALTRYQLLESLSASKLAQSGLDSYSHINGTGNLPHREVGKLTFDKLDKQADGFVGALHETSLTPLTPVEVNLTVANIQLLGWVKNLTTNGLLFYRPAKVTAKDRLVAWIHHVMMAAIGRSVVTRHIGLSESVDYKRLPQEQAKALLQQWVELYLAGRKQPLPFFVKSSEKWCQTAKMTEVAKMFNGSSFNQIPGEGDDLYIERVFKDVNNLPEAFGQLAEQIFKPLFDAVEE